MSDWKGLAAWAGDVLFPATTIVINGIWFGGYIAGVVWIEVSSALPTPRYSPIPSITLPALILTGGS
jgi:hypothetical protein